jgi:hypothetical protein
VGETERETREKARYQDTSVEGGVLRISVACNDDGLREVQWQRYREGAEDVRFPAVQERQRPGEERSDG